MKTLEKIANIAGKHVSVIQLSNGEQALIGFKTFDEARSIAEEYGFEIEMFTKRDGDKWWKREYITMYEDFEISAADYSEVAMEYTRDDAATFYKNEIEPLLSEMMDESDVTAEDIFKYIESCKRLYDEIVNLKEGEIVIAQEGCYPITVDKHTMYFSEDCKSKVIGLIRDSSKF